MKQLLAIAVIILAYGFLCYSMGKNVGELQCYFERIAKVNQYGNR